MRERWFFWFLPFVITFFCVTEAMSQSPERGKTFAARVADGDTLFIMNLPPVSVVASRKFDSRLAEYRYNRLVRNVKVVYPYARLAGIMFREYLEELEKLETEWEQRAYTREMEQVVRDRFEDDLKRLNFSQGLILLKLLDRETKYSTYSLLREFRGAFSAVFWQSLGRLFGFNLRIEYDPEGEDKEIEEVVRLIEEGLI